MVYRPPTKDLKLVVLDVSHGLIGGCAKVCHVFSHLKHPNFHVMSLFDISQCPEMTGQSVLRFVCFGVHWFHKALHFPN